jgi:hypothetical protein
MANRPEVWTVGGRVEDKATVRQGDRVTLRSGDNTTAVVSKSQGLKVPKS